MDPNTPLLFFPTTGVVVFLFATATAVPSLPPVTAVLMYNLHTLKSIYFKCTTQLLVNLQNYAAIIKI